MPAAARFGGFVWCFTVVPSLVAGSVLKTRTKRRTCPLAHCQSDNVDAGADAAVDTSPADNAHYNYNFLEISSKKTAVKAKGCGGTFLPAHFTCSSCDKQTCVGCKNLVCDLSKCTGAFFSQECWCTKPANPAIFKNFCDSDCTGGLCNTKGLTCKTRESSCQPWWWCQLPPPKEPQAGQGFIQKFASHLRRQGGCATKVETSQSANKRLEQDRAQHSLSVQTQTKAAFKKQIEAFDFSVGSWTCESALLPQPDEDPVTLATTPAGFIVLNADTCTGGFFARMCYCWDNFLYYRGLDPKVTELKCDSGCNQGPCGGRTCGTEAPKPLPKPTYPPPMDPMMQEMLNEANLRNYGTQMSPVQ